MSIQTKTADATWGREEFELFQNAGFFQAFDVQDNGAYLNKDKVKLLGIIGEAGKDELAWTPQYELPNGRPHGSPALPFKFGANQLAALMLDGEGWFLYDLATDPEAVAEVFAGVEKKSARDALAAAIEAMDAAENATGKRPKFSGNKNKPMIIKRSTPEERALRDAWVKKVARYEVKYAKWRRRMASELLKPEDAPETTEPRQAPQQSTAQTAPVTMTRRALLDAYKDEWDGIYNDLNNAGRNGLSAAAKSSTGQRWNEQAALEWARRNGKLSKKKSGIQTFTFHKMDR